CVCLGSSPEPRRVGSPSLHDALPISIIVPEAFLGGTMELCQSKRGQMNNMDFLSQDRVELRYRIPLGEIIFDFFDSLKSRTKGRSEEHTSELQSRFDLVCRLLLEKKK